MPRTPRSLPLLFLGAAALAACNQKHVASPDSAAASLRAADEVVFGFEVDRRSTSRRIALGADDDVVGRRDALPKEWDPLDPQPLANRPFKILSKKTIEGGALTLHPTISIALELSDERDNTVMWVRNEAALSSEEATQDWSCAFDREAVVAARGAPWCARKLAPLRRRGPPRSRPSSGT